MTQPRAARWSRVSSAQQATDDRNGLPAQREEQDRAIARLGLHDTGIEWIVTESGATVHETREFRAMLASAGKSWDVLVIAYVTRIGRNTAEGLRAIEAIAAAGGSVYVAEDNISTTSERDWETFAQDLLDGDKWRRRHIRTMRRSYETKWRRRALQVANAPMGYNADWSINEEQAAKVRALFTEYAKGGISIDKLAKAHQLEPEAVKNTLRSRTYLGEAGHRVYDEAQPRQSRYQRAKVWIAGKHEPIISQELYDAVATARQRRKRAGGNTPAQPNMLSKRAACACGTPLRLDGRTRAGVPRIRHPNPCEAWGRHERRPASWFEDPIKQALSDIRLTPEHIDVLVEQRPYSAPPTPPRFDKEREQIARDLVAGRISGPEAEILLKDSRKAEHYYLDDLRRSQQSQLTPEKSRLALERLAEGLAMLPKDTSEQAWIGIVSRYFDQIVYVDADTIRLIPSDEGREALVAGTWPPLVEVFERPRRESNPRPRP